MAPKVSVIVPMYNVEKYVGLAIESLIAQTFTDFELIVIDDCSTDRSLEIVKKFNDPRVKIIELEKKYWAICPMVSKCLQMHWNPLEQMSSFV